MPMMAGSTPTAAKERKTPSTGSCRRSASRRVISSTAPAPSLTCETHAVAVSVKPTVDMSSSHTLVRQRGNARLR